MKRTTVDVDESLLEEAAKVAEGDTYSAVVAQALKELVRVANLKRGIHALREADALFWPNYLEDIRPNSWAAYEKRRAAYEGREPEK